MERFIDLKTETDQKLYSCSDLAKLGCNECKGCSDCCRGMGKSIVLDPIDVHLLKQGLNMSFEELLANGVEISVFNGVILPNLALKGEKESCHFLDTNGRCNIHKYRPGICRMFPLGRIYENNGFKYFLQVNECSAKNKTKVKIDKWLDRENLVAYEKFVNDWHYFLKQIEEHIKGGMAEEMVKNINVIIINWFYKADYNDFYQEFYERLNKIKNVFEEA